MSAAFANAPNRAHVPVSAHRTPGELLIASFVAQWWTIAPAIVAMFAYWAWFLTGAEQHASEIKLACATIGLVCFLWGTRYRIEQRNDRDVFFAQYAHARGLTFHDILLPEGRVPLMRTGDVRMFQQCVRGKTYGLDAWFGNFTAVTYSNQLLNKREEASRHEFLVLHVRLPSEVARRYRAVQVRRRGASDKAGNFDGRRKVNFESIEFEQRYDVHVTKTQDDIALYELFSPPFIEALTRGPKLAWQQTGADLVFYRPEHCDATMQLDRFVIDVQFVVQRYLEEWK